MTWKTHKKFELAHNILPDLNHYDAKLQHALHEASFAADNPIIFLQSLNWKDYLEKNIKFLDVAN